MMLIVLYDVKRGIKNEHRKSLTEYDTLFESIKALRTARHWVYA